MAFPNSNWPCGGGDLNVFSWSWTSEVRVCWKIYNFLGKCRGERHQLKSDGFAYGGAIWNLFASFDGKKVHSLFGINVQGHKLLDSVLDCHCDVSFRNMDKLKGFKNILLFKCESGDSHCAVEDFLTELELDKFLLKGYEIDCKIIIQIEGKNLSSYRDNIYPCGGDDLKVSAYTPEEVGVFWTIKSFLSECLGEKHTLRSEVFSFAGATWNLFASFDRATLHSLFGISVQNHRSSDTVLDCYCTITFKETSLKEMKNILFKFKCDRIHTQCTVKDFLPFLELNAFLTRGAHIVCRINVKKSSVKEASLQAESQLQERVIVPGRVIPEKVPPFCVKVKDNELPIVNLESKVFKDFKNLLLSGEGTDVTIQVQNQQFEAHRSILTARSSVFAAMFHHDTKEKATGVVNVADCDPTSFPVFLEFLYCGSTEKLSVENVSSLYTSADKYDLQDLKMKCLQFIKSNLSEDIFFKTLHVSVQLSETNLLQVAKEFFIKNCNKIISTPEWHTFILENPIRGNELFVEAAKYFSPTPL